MVSLGRMAVMGCLLVALAFMANAEISVKKGSVDINGMVELETAEMMKARTAMVQKHVTVDHAWYSHVIGTLNFIARPSDRFSLNGSFEFKQYMNMSIWWATAMNRGGYNLGDFLYHDFFIREAQAVFTTFEGEALSLKLSLGYQPYKYNNEGREFGEYLFRSGTYPFLLFGEFDRPFSRLTGLRAATEYSLDFLKARLDLFALTERELRPYWDLSFAGVIGVSLMKIIEIGGGVNLANLVAMNDKYTTPHHSQCSFLKDSTFVSDSLGDRMVYDTGYYTFKGTKLMARGAIDLFGIFQFADMSRGDGSFISDLFGSHGGKIYGEIGIIGLENYPANQAFNPLGYDTLSQKMPWMVGIHLPFWKLLDECAFELEWYPNHYPNNSAQILWRGLPLPYLENINDAEGYTADRGARWYWSLYLKKQIIKNFTVVSQFGRDHLRWEMPMPYYNSNYDFEEAMCKPNHWGWHVKTIFSF
ncbi:MAG: hypothetical protein JXA71_00555 [Chitinispirillaceae bacterium]|nr:hypothetical protein [Chitinispirillaceae bacterium]